MGTFLVFAIEKLFSTPRPKAGMFNFFRHMFKSTNSPVEQELFIKPLVPSHTLS